MYRAEIEFICSILIIWRHAKGEIRLKNMKINLNVQDGHHPGKPHFLYFRRRYLNNVKKSITNFFWLLLKNIQLYIPPSSLFLHILMRTITADLHRNDPHLKSHHFAVVVWSKQSNTKVTMYEI